MSYTNNTDLTTRIIDAMYNSDWNVEVRKIFPTTDPMYVLNCTTNPEKGRFLQVHVPYRPERCFSQIKFVLGDGRWTMVYPKDLTNEDVQRLNRAIIQIFTMADAEIKRLVTGVSDIKCPADVVMFELYRISTGRSTNP